MVLPSWIILFPGACHWISDWSNETKLRACWRTTIKRMAGYPQDFWWKSTASSCFGSQQKAHLVSRHFVSQVSLPFMGNVPFCSDCSTCTEQSELEKCEKCEQHHPTDACQGYADRSAVKFQGSLNSQVGRPSANHHSCVFFCLSFWQFSSTKPLWDDHYQSLLNHVKHLPCPLFRGKGTCSKAWWFMIVLVHNGNMLFLLHTYIYIYRYIYVYVTHISIVYMYM